MKKSGLSVSIFLVFWCFMQVSFAQQNTLIQAAAEDHWAAIGDTVANGFVSAATTSSYGANKRMEYIRFQPTGQLALPAGLAVWTYFSSGSDYEVKDIQKAPASGATPQGYYLVGTKTTNNVKQIFLLRIKANGGLVWARVHSATTGVQEEGVAAAVMPNSDVVVVGSSTTAGLTTTYAAKITAGGTTSWGNYYNCSCSTPAVACNFIPREITIDVTNGGGTPSTTAPGIAITGEMTTSATNTNHSLFISAITNAGAEVWRMAYPANANYQSSAGYDIIQGTGNALIAVGKATKSTGQTEIYAVQVLPTSSQTWGGIITPSGTTTVTNTYARTITAVANSQNTYVLAGPDFATSQLGTGSSTPTPNGTTFFLQLQTPTSCTAVASVTNGRFYPTTMAHPSASESITPRTGGYFISTNVMGTTAGNTEAHNLVTNLQGKTVTSVDSCPSLPKTYSVANSCQIFQVTKCQTSNAQISGVALSGASVNVTENYCPTTSSNPCSIGGSLTYSTNSCGVASFNVSPTGCTGGAISYSWMFGNGTGMAGGATVSHAYTQTAVAQTFNACVIMTCTQTTGTVCSDTLCVNVQVPPALCNIQVGFTQSSQCGTYYFVPSVLGCSSTAGTTYSWDFGDGTSSTLANPSHVFTQPASLPSSMTYNVCLYVTCVNSCGVTCTQSICMPITVTFVNCSFTPDFTYTVDNCGTISVNANTVSCPCGTVTYSWSNGATGQTATVGATAAGATNVCLYVTCTTPTGTCTQNVCKTVTVPATGATSNFCYQVSSNSKTVYFTGVTTTGCTGGTKTYTWDFGDGTCSYATTPPAKTYTNPGTYNVCLVTKCTINGVSCCTQCCKTIVVPKPCPTMYAYFTHTVPISGYNVSFTNASSTDPCITYNWTFYNAAGTTVLGTSTLKSPAFNFAAAGTYKVCLTVQCAGAVDGANCVKSHCKTITLNNNAGCIANANFRYVQCTSTPNTVTFTNLTGSISGYTYSWDFGDGTTYIGYTPPAKTYANPLASYMVCFTVTGPDCSSNICMRVNATPKVCASVLCPTACPVPPIPMMVVPSSSQNDSHELDNQARVSEEIDNPIRFYPNPTDGLLKIQTSEVFESGTQITVTDMLGNLVYQREIGAEISEIEIDMNEQNAGIYLVTLRKISGESVVRKIIKE